jgi:XTP/dITP diphosphohydrolase
VDEFPEAPEVAETEDTFEGNALLKARSLTAHTGLPAIADDSGLCVDALSGAPGVHSARWSAATHDVDQANLAKVLAQMSDVPDSERGAAFVCVAAYADPSGQELVARGELRGQLLRAPVGGNGFGYDPIFLPEGRSETTAQMTSEEKDAISHRGLALRSLVTKLQSIWHSGHSEQ